MTDSKTDPKTDQADDESTPDAPGTGQDAPVGIVAGRDDIPSDPGNSGTVGLPADQ